ncbi:hypothetical protein B6U74_01020 [Candidatus Bathyarchaeota archaeon ex4484_205]|nr:MAG: hypothetical protein B6U74_01020 [Candidatus Bathyarchaeota archaeon ex4484_205]
MWMGGESLTEIWTEKHMPQKVSEIVGNTKVITEFYNWLKNWSPEYKEKGALLYGPPGVGKTLTVHVTAKELGYRLIELNASDYRTREALKERIWQALTTRSLIGGYKRMILLDEVDGMSGREDRGGVEFITKMLEVTRIPIVMTANDPWSRILYPLRKSGLVKMFRYRRVPKQSVMKRLREIARREGVNIGTQVLEVIAENSGGDVRSAIEDFQLVVKTGGLDGASIFLGSRRRSDVIFNVLRKITYAQSITSLRMAVSSLEENPDELFEWIYENIPNIKRNPRDLFKSFELLSFADYFYRNMRSRGDWSWISYLMELVPSVLSPLTGQEGKIIPKYNPPTRVRYIFSARKKWEKRIKIAKEIGKRIHLSGRRVLHEVVPFLPYILSNKKIIPEESWNILTDYLEDLREK